ncbi:hypothetical protein [Trinickia mobilis]|uniref:hypothetical protein n=1 Tax=Trinickia mobilis TaxID=2816356 RepID=UPI001A8D3DC3|nr:hypothetical protein [Trinickia mobilis]
MDRRTFVKTGAWLTVGGWLPPWLADALKKPGGMAIYDASLAASRAFADSAACGGTQLFAIEGDVGVLWYARLAPCLARTNAPLAGVIRASDFFVLKHLAVAANRTVLQVERHGAGGACAVAFLIGNARLRQRRSAKTDKPDSSDQTSPQAASWA